jgi:hypothetical protein
MSVVLTRTRRAALALARVLHGRTGRLVSWLEAPPVVPDEGPAALGRAAFGRAARGRGGRCSLRHTQHSILSAITYQYYSTHCKL